MLEEAASELFLEQTYAGTTIEQIAGRAGVSRNTFFNYFGAKSDVLWAGVDDAISGLGDDFAVEPTDVPALTAVRAGLLRAAERFGPSRLPLAITQFEVMGMPEELGASGLTRFSRMAVVMQRFLAARLGADSEDASRVIAFALAGAVAAAAGSWARAGTNRSPLTQYVSAAITPIIEGFTTALGQK